jgi:cytochrome c-type biogenesis protein
MIFKKESDPKIKTFSPATPPKRQSKWKLYVILFVGTILLIFASRYFEGLYNSLGDIVSQIEAPYQKWLEQQNTSNPTVLIPLAFVGGLIASISPCILSLLPVNLSYIGTLKINSRRDAFFKAGQFVLGVVTIFSLLQFYQRFELGVFSKHSRGTLGKL